MKEEDGRCVTPLSMSEGSGLQGETPPKKVKVEGEDEVVQAMQVRVET